MQIDLRWQRRSLAHKALALLSPEDNNCTSYKACSHQLNPIHPPCCKFQQGRARVLCRSLGNSYRRDRVVEQLGHKENKTFQ